MTDMRHKNENWQIKPNDKGVYGWEGAQLAVLMDIRDELQRLNRIFECENFLSVPYKLDCIERNTRRPKRRTPSKRA